VNLARAARLDGAAWWPDTAKAQRVLATDATGAQIATMVVEE
jgi:hypothetical protein